MKIDFKKAFESAQWSFFRELLGLLGFPSRFIHLVMQSVETTSFSIAINGNFSSLVKVVFGRGVLFRRIFSSLVWSISLACLWECLSNKLSASIHNVNLMISPILHSPMMSYCLPEVINLLF